MLINWPEQQTTTHNILPDVRHVRCTLFTCIGARERLLVTIVVVPLTPIKALLTYSNLDQNKKLSELLLPAHSSMISAANVLRGHAILVENRVIELERGGTIRKANKPRLIALTRSQGDMWFVVLSGEVDTAKPLKKRVTMRDWVMPPEISGSLEATFAFSHETATTVSFESSSQREQFVSRMKREYHAALAAEGGGGAVGGDGLGLAEDDAGGTIGILTAMGGGGGHRRFAAAASGSGGSGGAGRTAMQEVLRRRQLGKAPANAEGASNRILSDKEQAVLLREMSCTAGTFDRFEDFLTKLDKKIVERETQLTGDLLESSRHWGACVEAINSLSLSVNHIEQRLQNYGRELTSRKSVIEEIELESTTRQRARVNIDDALNSLKRLIASLKLSGASEDALKSIRAINNSLSAQSFFTSTANVTAMTDAFAAMQKVTAKDGAAQLEAEYGKLNVIGERRTVFLEYRRITALRLRLYLLHLVATKAEALLGAKVPVSKRKAIVLKPPTELYRTIGDVRAFVPALKVFDPVGHHAVVRRVCGFLREYFSRQVTAFFKELRRVVKKASWTNGSLKLDDTSLTTETLRELREQGEVGPVSGGTVLGGKALFGSFPDPPKPPPPKRSGDDDGEEVPFVTVELNATDELGERLLRDALNKASFPERGAGGIASRPLLGRIPAGSLRPDVVVAIALKGTADMVLSHRTFLRDVLLVKGDVQPYMLKLSSQADQEGDDVDDDIDETTRISELLFGPGKRDRVVVDEDAELDPDYDHEVEPAVTTSSRSDGGGGGAKKGPLSLFTRKVDPSEDRCHVPPTLPRPKELEQFADDAPVEPTDTLALAMWDSFAPLESTVRFSEPLIQRELISLWHFIAKVCDGCHWVATLSLLHCTNEALQRMLSVEEAAAMQDTTTAEGGDGGVIAGSPGVASPTAASPTAPRDSRQDVARRRRLLSPCVYFLEDTVKALVMLSNRSQHEYLTDQLQAVKHCSQRRSAMTSFELLPCFPGFALLLSRMETMLHDQSRVVRQPFEGLLLTLTNGMFEAVDAVTSQDDSRNSGADDEATTRRQLFRQYLHQAFFCAVIHCSTSPITKGVLQPVLERSISQRDRLEEMYLAQTLLPDSLPQLCQFVALAEDVQRTHERADEIVLFNDLNRSSTTALLEMLSKEVSNGVRSLAERIRRHFTKAVPKSDAIEGFFMKSAMSTIYQHASKLVVGKVQSLCRFLAKCHPDLTCPVTPREVSDLLTSAAQQ